MHVANLERKVERLIVKNLGNWIDNPPNSTSSPFRASVSRFMSRGREVLGMLGSLTRGLPFPAKPQRIFPEIFFRADERNSPDIGNALHAATMTSRIRPFPRPPAEMEPQPISALMIRPRHLHYPPTNHPRTLSTPVTGVPTPDSAEMRSACLVPRLFPDLCSILVVQIWGPLLHRGMPVPEWLVFSTWSTSAPDSGVDASKVSSAIQV